MTAVQSVYLPIKGAARLPALLKDHKKKSSFKMKSALFLFISQSDYAVMSMLAPKVPSA